MLWISARICAGVRAPLRPAKAGRRKPGRGLLNAGSLPRLTAKRRGPAVHGWARVPHGPRETGIGIRAWREHGVRSAASSRYANVTKIRAPSFVSTLRRGTRYTAFFAAPLPAPDPAPPEFPVRPCRHRDQKPKIPRQVARPGCATYFPAGRADVWLGPYTTAASGLAIAPQEVPGKPVTARSAPNWWVSQKSARHSDEWPLHTRLELGSRSRWRPLLSLACRREAGREGRRRRQNQPGLGW